MSLDLDNRVRGYSWGACLGTAFAGAVYAASLYFSPIAYAQQERPVNVVAQGAGQAGKEPAVSPGPATGASAPAVAPPGPGAIAPAAPAGVAGPSPPSPPAEPRKTSPPKVQYGTSPLCGTDLAMVIGTDSVNLSDYQCLTLQEAGAKGIDPKSGLAWGKYTKNPAEACPGKASCYRLPEQPVPPVEPAPAAEGGVVVPPEPEAEVPGAEPVAPPEPETGEEGQKAPEAEAVAPPGDSQLAALGRIELTLADLTVALTAGLEASEEVERRRAEEQARQQRAAAAKPSVSSFSGAYLTAEALGGDSRGVLAAYGVGVAVRVADRLNLEAAGGVLYQHGDLEQRASPEPTSERRLLPDGTTHKLTSDQTTAVVADQPTGFFGRLRGAYQTPLQWLRAFVGTDVRGREEGARATGYERTVSLERNGTQLRAPKTISDTETAGSSWNAGMYPHGGVQACRSLGPVTGCLEAQGGYDFHTDSPRYGGGARLTWDRF